jgi:hypothetical protein
MATTVELAATIPPRKEPEMPEETLTTRVGRVIAGGPHTLIDRREDQAPDAMMEQPVREAESVIGEVRRELDRLYQRQTGLRATARSTGPQQEAQLKELDDLVCASKVAERLPHIKASKA